MPGERVQHIEHVIQRTILHQRLIEAQRVHVQELGRDVQVVSLQGIEADDHVIGVEGLGEADGGSARRLKALRQAEMFECVLAILAANDVKARGTEPLVEGLRDGFADPIQIGLAGAVIEGKDEQELMMRLRRQGGGLCRGLVFCLCRWCAESAEQRHRWEQKQRAQWMKWPHAAPIIVPRAGTSAGDDDWVADQFASAI